jgi:hypothetical protein
MSRPASISILLGALSSDGPYGVGHVKDIGITADVDTVGAEWVVLDF